MRVHPNPSSSSKSLNVSGRRLFPPPPPPPPPPLFVVRAPLVVAFVSFLFLVVRSTTTEKHGRLFLFFKLFLTVFVVVCVSTLKDSLIILCRVFTRLAVLLFQSYECRTQHRQHDTNVGVNKKMENGFYKIQEKKTTKRE